jgi:hypothetical protein
MLIGIKHRGAQNLTGPGQGVKIDPPSIGFKQKPTDIV